MTLPRRLWLPGEWLGTNMALRLLKLEGHYRGKWGSEPRTPDTWTEHARRSRLRAAAGALNARMEAPSPGVRLNMHVRLVGHERQDPDAWYVAGKWIADGLIDAWHLPSDRGALFETSGRVCQTAEESAAYLGRFGFGVPRACDRQGAVVLLDEVQP